MEILRFIGLGLIVIGLFFVTLAKFFPKIRLLFFKDTSMVGQYIFGFVLMLLGVGFLVVSGAI